VYVHTKTIDQGRHSLKLARYSISLKIIVDPTFENICVYLKVSAYIYSCIRVCMYIFIYTYNIYMYVHIYM